MTQLENIPRPMLRMMDNNKVQEGKMLWPPQSLKSWGVGLNIHEVLVKE